MHTTRQVWPQEWRLARACLICALTSLALALVRVMVFIAWPVLVLVSPAALRATSASYILIEELSPLLALLCGVSAIVLGHLAQLCLMGTLSSQDKRRTLREKGSPVSKDADQTIADTAATGA